jgi:lysophospholipase L1-like esterase
MATSYEDIVQGAYGAIGRTGIGANVGQIDPEGFNFWLDALKAGVVTPDQLYANFNKSVAETIQQQPQVANSQAVAAYIAANPLATQIDPTKVVAVGDSTTWGYNAGNQVAENMVTTAQKALGSDYSVSNLGINSTTAGDFLNSTDFDKALSSGAGTVVLNYGMNEAYRNEDPATFAKNLLTAVQTLQAVGKKVILQTPNSTGSSTKPEDAWTQNVGAYANIVRDVAKQTGTTLDDKFTYTSTLTNATSSADIVHPTAATYGLLGTNLADAIKTTTTGVAPKAISVTAPVVSAQTPSLVANQATAPVDPTVKLFQDTLGRAPTQGEIERFGGDIKEGQLSNFLGYARNEAVNTLPSTGAAANIASQILAQGTTDKWDGQGYGSPEKNAYDMGVMLAGQGIKDIKDFGQRTTPNGKTEFFNKATGEAIKPFYDKADGNIWGGTFAGKDSTAYGVEFDASGNPLFYSVYGGDSSDVPSWVKPALIIGGAYLGLNAAGLLGGAGAAAGTAGVGSLTAGITLADIAAAEALLPTIGGAGAIAGGAGLLSGGGSLTAGFTPAQIAAAEAGLPSLGGSLTAGLTPAQIAAAEVALPTSGSLTAGMTAAQIAAAEAGLPGLTAAETTALYGGASSLTAGLTPAQIAAAEAGLPVTTAAGTVAGSNLLTDAATRAGVSTAVNSVLGGGTNLGNILNTGLTTGAGLLQQQTSREAAIAAQKMIDAETAAAKQAAAFRPVGMTTRFGTSQFGFDPKTGQMTSAGYTLSPEAKAQQDRFMVLSNQGLTQAEAAQAQFAPLQTGAQSLFTLGNKYIAQSPESVAQNYLNQQMALLQPGRQLELATLQNRLQQQGRGGLAVAQGGTMGATTPELQALYNARAQQEAQLAANAQQAGQQQVAFGAGLLGQGAGAMGQYYAGQQAAYAPYTTAMGQVQALEAAGQQPFTLSSQLGQAASTAGARAGALGLEGANISQRLATGAAATTNPYATALGGATSNPAFAQLLSNIASGLFSGTPQASLTTGFAPSSIAAGESGLPVDYSFLYS